MRWYQIVDIGNGILHIVEAIAWPLTVLIIFFVLRMPLLGVVKRIAKIKYGDTEITISAEIDRIQEAIAPVVDAQVPGDLDVVEAPDGIRLEVVADPFASEFQSLREVAATSPELAILRAWSLLEQEIKMASGARDPGRQRPALNTFRLIQRVFEQGKISKEIFSALHDMRQLRNRIAHEVDRTHTTTDDAYRYLDVTQEIARALRSAR